MKDSALVVVDLLCDGPVEDTLKAIDKLTAGTEADETGIHSTYPILFVRNHSHEVHEALQPYVKEYLTFFREEGCNPAGQNLGEILSLLDIQHVLVCGIATENDIRKTAEDLQKDGFDVRILALQAH